jgi:hypothetical protein
VVLVPPVGIRACGVGASGWYSCLWRWCLRLVFVPVALVPPVGIRACGVGASGWYHERTKCLKPRIFF